MTLYTVGQLMLAEIAVLAEIVAQAVLMALMVPLATASVLMTRGRASAAGEPNDNAAGGCLRRVLRWT